MVKLIKLVKLRGKIESQNIELAKKYCVNAPDSFTLNNENKRLRLKVFNMGLLGRGSILDKKKILFSVLHENQYYLFIFDLVSFEFLDKIDSKRLQLEQIDSIMINNKSEILIYDSKTCTINLYDSNFTKTGNFLIENSQKISNFNISDITIDKETNDIYCVSCFGISSILRIDYLTKETVCLKADSNKFFKPRFIRVVNNQIFIVNLCSLRIDQESREMESIFGDSSIHIYDKNPFRIKFSVSLKEYSMCQPWGLVVDKQSNIYTTVSKVNKTKNSVSKGKYFLKLTKNGEYVEETLLNEKIDFLCNDMFYLNNMLLIYKENLIYCYELS